MIEIRRNRTISCKVISDGAGCLKDLFKMSKEQKDQQDRYERLRQKNEARLWALIEKSKTPVLDLLGQPVRKETHEICWEPTGKETKHRNGVVTLEMKPYIQPIKSEYEK